MKKWHIITVVAMFLALIALKLLDRKSPGADPASRPGLAEPLGVQLPAASPGASVAPPIPDSESVCKGGSLAEILASHGRIWGRDPRDGVYFQLQQNRELYTLMVRYFACRAAAFSDIRNCDSLPDEYRQGASKYSTSLRHKCVEDSDMVPFAGFMAGTSKSDAACRRFMGGEFMEGLKISPDAFCSAAAKGMDGVCSSIQAQLPSDGDCYSSFPRNTADCKGKEKCLEKFRLYKALKESKVTDIPAVYREIYSASTTRNPEICEQLARELSSLYCKYLKAAGAEAGMRDEERKRKTEQAKEQAKEQTKAKEQEAQRREAQHKEQEAQQAEINKRIRKLLGK